MIHGKTDGNAYNRGYCDSDYICPEIRDEISPEVGLCSSRTVNAVNNGTSDNNKNHQRDSGTFAQCGTRTAYLKRIFPINDFATPAFPKNRTKNATILRYEFFSAPTRDL
jgi:hypothetical protein